MLSAQCTDVRVHLVPPALFKRFSDAAAAVEADAVEPYVKSTALIATRRSTSWRPAACWWSTMAAPCLAPWRNCCCCRAWPRKTASVVLAWCYGINAGVTVDTHVSRLSQRLGLSRRSDPRTIEPDLMRLVPQADWQTLSIRLIFHGRALCTARKPRCLDCPIAELCPSHPGR